MRRGIVYAVSHIAWAEETAVSVKSCRRVMPDVDIEIYATWDVLQAIDPTTLNLVTSIVELQTLEHNHRPRFESMQQTKLDEVIFIDSDTYFVEPVYELFDMLRHYDIGAFMAPQYIHEDVEKTGVDKILPQVSEALPEWNTGVLVGKVDNKFRAFANKWSRMLTECVNHGYKMDQYAFRVTLIESDLRNASLPNNYNFRAQIPQSVARSVKILHAHGELEKIATIINTHTFGRLYQPQQQLLYGFFPKGFQTP